MFDILQFEFIRNALIAGVLAGVICGVIGTLVVVNRIVFLSGGVAHAAYGGIGMALFFGWPYLFGTIGFSLFCALIMAIVSLKAQHRSDTIIGVIWAVGMALGIILIDLTPGYHPDLMSYLFGSILSVSDSDLWLMFFLSLLVLGAVVWLYGSLLAMSYDPEFAQLRGIPVPLLYLLLIGMVTISIVILIRVVGLILVIALLTIPPFIAEKYSGSLSKMMLFSSLLSIFFTISGLWLSYYLNVTSGATIILVAGICFFISMGVERLLNRPEVEPGKKEG